MASRVPTSVSKGQSTAGRGLKARRKNRGVVYVIAVVAVAVIALGAVFALNNSRNGQAGKYPFQVGRPGPGEAAPAIQLPSTRGGSFDLASLRGKTVLLYFQEGIMCQPCWDQLKDIEAQMGQFQALGIDTIVSITTDDLDQLRQKVADQGIATPVLSDPQLAVSRAYTANNYGMMGTSRDGHTFIIVGPDGRIRWRADYGGAPKYTMYVPASNLLADIRVGLEGARQSQ